MPARVGGQQRRTVAPSAQRIKGKIDAYDPATRTLSVTTSDKKSVSVTLEPDLRVIYDAKRTLNDIKAGDFIGSATLKTADGKLRAQEVHVFPDSMRGAGEGQYATSDANPNRAMTNATVAEVEQRRGEQGLDQADLSRQRRRQPTAAARAAPAAARDARANRKSRSCPACRSSRWWWAMNRFWFRERRCRSPWFRPRTARSLRRG